MTTLLCIAAGGLAGLALGVAAAWWIGHEAAARRRPWNME